MTRSGFLCTRGEGRKLRFGSGGGGGGEGVNIEVIRFEPQRGRGGGRQVSHMPHFCSTVPMRFEVFI